MSDIRIPGPGAAMALAAGAAVYAASQAKTTHFGWVILLVATFFGVCTLLIESLHKKGYWFCKPTDDQKTPLCLNEHEIKLIEDFIKYMKEKDSLNEQEIKHFKKFIKCMKEN